MYVTAGIPHIAIAVLQLRIHCTRTRGQCGNDMRGCLLGYAAAVLRASRLMGMITSNSYSR